MSSIGELPGFEAKWWDMLWETAQALSKEEWRSCSIPGIAWCMAAVSGISLCVVVIAAEQG
ncbi:hypothetical protein FJMB80055_45240 [Enterobacter hormaechei]|uniref:Uncharacterized protein n=3 Tax=Enterobacteriaceae TaxID=543 RepID=A0A7I8HLG9_9ENTR|nr:hypothetical protein ABR35_19865 [Enterobacter cloacae subsp. cloacae]OSM33325.1 hypothetical protein BKM34_23325 [Salmonella enterica subsp. enterica serovar Infantis]CAH2873857.1 hypothetical protein SEN2437_42310 [Salmonella enterica subsp. enterica serovar Virchow]BBZ89791.1 hypothetical protein EAA2563_44060 [Enterobacter asburiae]BCM22733.1 hypothetical protein [Enterobacter hormaechei subsp. xiangfangensis]BDI80905.1 hypothetical protein FJMB80001_45760 [Enterobacter hormaechei]BDO0